MGVSNARSITVKLSDGTSGTPQEIEFTLWTSINEVFGQHDTTVIMDKNGDSAGYPPIKGNAIPSVVTLSGYKVLDAGDDAALLTVADLIMRTGFYDSWISTTDAAGTCTNTIKTFNLEVTKNDCGTSKSYTLGEVVVTSPGITTEGTPPTADIVFTSPDPKPTFA